MHPSDVTEAEILAFLQAIEEGSVSLTPAWEPQDIYAGNVNYTASNGWTVTIFNDCNVWDYIERLRTADGRDCEAGQIDGHMPAVDAYEVSDEIAWSRYRIPGYCIFRCVKCGERITDRELIKMPYRCPKCTLP